MARNHENKGFTLIEMLVVIAIITILVAIMVPTIQSSRHQARMTECQTNMSTLVSALREYHRRHGRYPARPAFNSEAREYTGGFSELYPEFIDNYNYLICPSDQTIFGAEEEARERKYSTYNGVIALADDPSLDPQGAEAWEFAIDADGDEGDNDEDNGAPTGNRKITYNYNGYDYRGWDRDQPLLPGEHDRPEWLERGWRYYPRLGHSRSVPEYTVVTHCTKHRDFYRNPEDVRDTMIRLSGDMDTIVIQVWQHPENPEADPADRVSYFVTQGQ